MSDPVLLVYRKRHLKTIAELEQRISLLQRLVAEEEAEADRRGLDYHG